MFGKFNSNINNRYNFPLLHEGKLYVSDFKYNGEISVFNYQSMLEDLKNGNTLNLDNYLIYQKQKKLYQLSGLLNPFSSLQNLSMGFCGSDMIHHLDFLKKAEKTPTKVRSMCRKHKHNVSALRGTPKGKEKSKLQSKSEAREACKGKC